MLIQVDWYRKTGKWYSGGRVEVEPLPWENGIIKDIVKNQTILVEDWYKDNNFYLVISDITESTNDPNYRMTYNRMYSSEQISKRTGKQTPIKGAIPCRKCGKIDQLNINFNGPFSFIDCQCGNQGKTGGEDRKEMVENWNKEQREKL